MERVTTIADVRAAVRRARQQGLKVALVPTMGALHDGHLALVRQAANEAEFVVVSIFVNPAQFDRPDDLAAYPRDLGADERLLAALGGAAPAVVFAPEASEMYPQPPATRVQVTGLTERLCGASRPGHFDGVATVVTKLLAIVAPDIAVFGRKDRQQLAVIERLVEDLNLGVRIVGVPTVRDDDGVASSSRNARMTGSDRLAARALSRALMAGLKVVHEARAAGREVDTGVIADAMRTTMSDQDGVWVDYAEVVDPATLQPPEGPVAATDRLVLAVAGFVGPVRLIDNVEAGITADERALADALDASLIAAHLGDDEGRDDEESGDV